MKRFCWPVFSAVVVLVIAVNPVFAASKNNIPTQRTVTASAVIVPAQVSELGFLISGIAREIPIQEGDAVETGQTLAILDTPDLQYAVAEAEARVRAAQAQVEIKENEVIKKIQVFYRSDGIVVKKLRLDVPHEVLEIENANVQEAQAAVEIAQAKLAQGTLLAPYEGTIVSIRISPGEFVSSDQAVITLATLSSLQIETTDLNERDIQNVHIGDAVHIFVKALDKNVSGRVIGISPIAGAMGGDIVFKVTIAPDSQPEDLRWGMTAEVEITGGE